MSDFPAIKRVLASHQRTEDSVRVTAQTVQQAWSEYEAARVAVSFACRHCHGPAPSEWGGSRRCFEFPNKEVPKMFQTCDFVIAEVGK